MPSKHHLFFPRNQRLFRKYLAILENVRKCPETFVSTFDNFWRIFGNLTKVFGNLWKTVEKLVISLFVYIKRIRNSCLCYGIFLLVFDLIIHSFTALTREMSSLTLQISYLRATMYYRISFISYLQLLSVSYRVPF